VSCGSREWTGGGTECSRPPELNAGAARPNWDSAAVGFGSPRVKLKAGDLRDPP
jgi:hypothetical protein